MSAAGRWGVVWRWLPALAWMAVIFLLSSQSGLRLSEDDGVDRPLRALAHVAAYAMLAGLVLGALTWPRRPGLREASFALALVVIYGVGDEIHQSFVPDRSGRLEDVLIDTLGALIGVAVAWPILHRRADRRSAPRGEQEPGDPGGAKPA